MNHPLKFYFDTIGKISKAVLEKAQENILFQAIKDGIEWDSPEVTKEVSDIRHAVRLHNKQFVIAPKAPKPPTDVERHAVATIDLTPWFDVTQRISAATANLGLAQIRDNLETTRPDWGPDKLGQHCYLTRKAIRGHNRNFPPDLTPPTLQVAVLAKWHMGINAATLFDTEYKIPPKRFSEAAQRLLAEKAKEHGSPLDVKQQRTLSLALQRAVSDHNELLDRRKRYKPTLTVVAKSGARC